MDSKSCIIIGSGQIIGKKWSIPILAELSFEKNIGFNRLKKSLKQVSPRILSYRLKEFENANLIQKSKTPKQAHPNYSLTEKGKGLQQIILELKKWGIQWKEVEQKCLFTKCTECGKFH